MWERGVVPTHPLHRGLQIQETLRLQQNLLNMRQQVKGHHLSFLFVFWSEIWENVFSDMSTDILAHPVS